MSWNDHAKDTRFTETFLNTLVQIYFRNIRWRIFKTRIVTSDIDQINISYIYNCDSGTKLQSKVFIFEIEGRLTKVIWARSSKKKVIVAFLTQFAPIAVIRGLVSL